MASGEFVWRRDLSDIIPGGYGSAAAAAARDVFVSFIYWPMGFALRALLFVPRS